VHPLLRTILDPPLFTILLILVICSLYDGTDLTPFWETNQDHRCEGPLLNFSLSFAIHIVILKTWFGNKVIIIITLFIIMRDVVALVGLDFTSGGLGSIPRMGCHVVFLGKTLCSLSASSSWIRISSCYVIRWT